MEKDPTTHRRHRPGPGALPSGVVPGYLKVASEGAELQRSRSVGGLHQKGDPPVCIRKLLRKELDSEDQGKDPRSDTNDTTCQASLEEDRKKKSQDEPGKVDQTCGKLEPEKSNSEASASEQDGAQKGRHTSVAEVRLASGSSLINYYHTEEEVVTCAVREEKRPPLDTGDLSEDETRTSWMCCIPYSTKKKVKETANALEKSSQDRTPLTQPLVELSGN
uniref:RIKEN cDNA 1700029H14 gene n=1 Tax=Cricetulus griseus TaxID=10029 RepID=A0A8C2LVP9_CRIGR